MRFKIKSPWTQWLVNTSINAMMKVAKVDGVSEITLVGMSIASLLDVTEDSVIACQHVEYFDVSNSTRHRAFRVPLGNISLPFGNKVLNLCNLEN